MADWAHLWEGTKFGHTPARSPVDQQYVDALDRLDEVVQKNRREIEVLTDGMREDVRAPYLEGVTKDEAALATVRSTVERLREERDDLLNRLEISGALSKEAEAELARTREGLRDAHTELQKWQGAHHRTNHQRMSALVRSSDLLLNRIDALLAASPPDGGGAK